MPYDWKQRTESAQELHLWPHNSLPPRGAAAFILTLFAFGSMPLIAVLGSKLLWGLLPFLLISVAGVWLAIEMNYRQRRVLEVLTLDPERAHLVRHNPRGPAQEWDCNRYWARATMHPQGGPVPHYVTLQGAGREVEIGAFLSEDERIALYDDLQRALAQ